jgi:spermidine synthase
LDDPDGEALGTLRGFEALGALVGLPLMHFGLLPLIGLGGCVLLMGGLALLALFLRGPRDWVLATGALGLATFLLNFSKQGAPALASPPLQNPAFEILAFEEDQHFAISVVQDGLLGERTLLTDGFRAAANGRDYDYMRALAHLPLLLHPNPERVGVLAFGTGTTAGAVSLHTEPQHIDVLELSSTVTDYAHWFEEANRGVLQDSRVQVWIGDGRHTLRGKQGVYDVLTMEPLLPDSPFAVYLYTTEFYGVVRQSLAPGGLVCQWVPPHALAPKTFDAVLSAFTSAFEWSGIWVFGTQVILLGGEQAPQPDRGRFGGGSPVLRSALAGLGLQDLEGVLARYVVPGSDWPAAQRPLTDLDPWVIYAGRRKGSLLLADLPLNLAKLRKHAQPIPLEWSIGLGAGATSRMQALAYLREAREAFEGARASAAIGTQAQNGDSELLAAHGRLLQECSQADVDSLLTEVRRRAPQEAGLLRFEASLEFQTEIRRGFALLSGANSQEAAGQAAVHLTRAVVLRPERADVHAYLAVALARLGSDRSKLELEKARELCPNLAETPVGRRLVQLGL